jgi:hypothetical protein
MPRFAAGPQAKAARGAAGKVRGLTLSACAISFGGGGANVEVALFNRAFGTLPPFTIRVDWKQGQETSDVEALALQLLAQSVQSLGARAIEEAYRLSS